MAKLPFVFCDGPHAGPCPNRVIRLLSESAEQVAASSQACNAANILRQVVELGRGEDDLSCQAREGGECPHGADKPYFNEDLSELWARGVRLHGFGPLACNEVAVLKNLQTKNWRHTVFDPLGKGKSKKYGASLKTTVRRLKECQEPQLIEFHSHPKDRAVSWKWRLP